MIILTNYQEHLKKNNKKISYPSHLKFFLYILIF